jgi:predicted nuclease of restriction endonuclease-like (RecB) superfamily
MSEIIIQNTNEIDENGLFKRVAEIIEMRKYRAGAFANREIILVYWEVGKYINSVVLDGGRATYGKNILSILSTKLMTAYGNSFYLENIYRMMRFNDVFKDFEILSTASTKLSWSHFCEIMRVKTEEGRLFYIKDVEERDLNVQTLRKEISRKAYERRDIANSQLSESTVVPINAFKDPFLLDILGLKENYLEADLEIAILKEIEAFLLEFGKGLAFVARQKRMTMDGVDFKLDLLFYSRDLQRLIAIELKIGEFKPEYMGQMSFYLKWLDKFERREGENAPIGLILCTKAHRGQIELLELDKAGIAVAEYWTQLPPKAEFERKINEIFAEAQERLERRKDLPLRQPLNSPFALIRFLYFKNFQSFYCKSDILIDGFTIL